MDYMVRRSELDQLLKALKMSDGDGKLKNLSVASDLTSAMA